jgi:hypothetical protein
MRISLIVLLSFLTPIFISAAEKLQRAPEGCCTVETKLIEEMPNDSKLSYSVFIPRADYKMATKKMRSKLRSLSGAKAQRNDAFWVTNRFWWGNPMSDTVRVFAMVLPEENGTIIHASMATDTGWVDPGTGSLASYFSEELKNMAESIYGEVLKGKLSDLKSERKNEAKDLKKTNKRIKKIRKKIVKKENKISSLQNEITMLSGEQEKLIADISVQRTKMLDNKGEDKKAYKEAKKAKKKLNKQLKKLKRNEENNRKDILDYRDGIRKYEEDISVLRGTREHHKSRIQNLQQKRRDLKRQLRSDE